MMELLLPDNVRLISWAEVEPPDQDQPLRRVGLRVERALERPQLQTRDERRAGAGVHEADLHEVLRHNDDGLQDHHGVGGRDVHHGPEVDSDVEVEDGWPAEAVVVAVHEDGTEEELVPGVGCREGVAVARAVGEAAHVEVEPFELRRDVLDGDVAV
ncbi:hypothetical protein PR202_gb01879 [Eleusine coracana subsp. coracana]|uniref:Uncharacterized protein n=1 Tax=Eleusine coracana subsp. coracana TaxID=191504 RepID=A0AAV5DYM8_ELECO|nr:hypothetical protein PR202_gb01879 [Eleusine coracana subsp. coracana]